MGVKFHTSEKIKVGSTLWLEISVPTELEPLKLRGIVKWIGEGIKYPVGGIEYTELLDNDKFTQLGLF